MPSHDIIVIGASAGGVETLSQLVALLPANLRAAVFVVVHISEHSTSVLPNILTRRGVLKASHAYEGTIIENGHIYVAPPGHHLKLRDGEIAISRTARENGHRPAIDPLFRSAAHQYGKRVVAVVLSGTLNDGTAGIISVGQYGGVTIAQDPEEAMFPGMPMSAIAGDHIDFVLPVAQIAAKIVELSEKEIEDYDLPEQELSIDPETAVEASNYFDLQTGDSNDSFAGTPSVYTCPECHGALWEMEDEGILRFRCRVGHAYTAESLAADQSSALETALWTALRALEENAALYRRLCDRSVKGGRSIVAKQFKEYADNMKQQADVVRSVLIHGKMAESIEPSSNVME